MRDINEMVCVLNLCAYIGLVFHDFWNDIVFNMIIQSGTMIRRNQASFLTKTLVLTRRSFVNMYRDVGYYWLRLAIYVAISLSLGTIFYNLGHGYYSIQVSWWDIHAYVFVWYTDTQGYLQKYLLLGLFQARSSMLMFIGTLLTFMAIGGFPSFVEDMKVSSFYLSS